MPASPGSDPDRTTTVWVFDVDGTLIDAMTGQSLRPGADELLSHLADCGSLVLLWSAGGAEYARRRAAERGVDRHFGGFHGKETRGADGRYLTAFLDAHRLAGRDIVFVDDMPADLPIGADVVGVRPYLAANHHDRGLDVVARRIGAEIG